VSGWSKQMDDALVAMTQQEGNLSYLTIADAMSKRFEVVITKNACIGRARRLGVPQRNGKPHKPDPVNPSRRGKMIIIKVDAPIPPKIRRKHTGGVTLLELDQYRECHWPLAEVEDRPPYAFCGKPAVDGTSWCHDHSKRVFSHIRPVR
jgi:Uncharacterized protein conserved in bacteria